jgi:hypothetical protein
MFPMDAANNAEFADIRDQLRRDHESALAELEALRDVKEEDSRVLARLHRLRRAWMIHVLAEETVVYRAVEGMEATTHSKSRADERFAGHERLQALFERLARSEPGTSDWHAWLDAVRVTLMRRIESEHTALFGELAQSFGESQLREMGRQFELTREKLTFLEEAKAA